MAARRMAASGAAGGDEKGSQRSPASKIRRQRGKVLQDTAPHGAEAILDALRGQKPRKYGNKKVSLDGYVFDSQAEGKRYVALRERLRRGEIMDLEVHPPYRLEVNGVLVCRYVADFAYHDPETYAETVEDVKGVRTQAYVIKRKLMRALLGIDVQEVKV